MECIYELIHHGMYCNLNLKIYYYPTMKISKMIFEIRFGMRFIYFIRSYVKNSLKIRMGNQKSWIEWQTIQWPKDKQWKLKTEQQNPTKKAGVNSDAPEENVVPAPLVAPEYFW